MRLQLIGHTADTDDETSDGETGPYKEQSSSSSGLQAVSRSGSRPMACSMRHPR